MPWNNSKPQDLWFWEKLLAEDWLGDIDKQEWFIVWEWSDTKLSSLCNWNCEDCMNTIIDDYKNRLNQILCCKSHPETWEIDSETNACPEFDIETGMCKIYNDPDKYPEACKNYHCKTHSR